MKTVGLAISNPGRNKKRINKLKGRVSDLESSVESATNEIDELDSRVLTLESNTSETIDFDGFAVPFSDDGVQKNAVILVTELPDGGISYSVRSRYANSVEQISINGIPTVRPFIANYVNVLVDTNGDITSIYNYIEAPDTAAYNNFDIEESFYDTASLSKTVIRDDTRELWNCTESTNPNLQCVVTGILSSTGDYSYTRDFANFRSVVSGPLTLSSSLTITEDLRLENYGSIGYSRQQFRIRAKGIGQVYRLRLTSDGSREEQKAIYYQSNGATGGSLEGTPFEPGQPLDGLFF